WLRCRCAVYSAAKTASATTTIATAQITGFIAFSSSAVTQGGARNMPPSPGTAGRSVPRFGAGRCELGDEEVAEERHAAWEVSASGRQHVKWGGGRMSGQDRNQLLLGDEAIAEPRRQERDPGSRERGVQLELQVIADDPAMDVDALDAARPVKLPALLAGD